MISYNTVLNRALTLSIAAIFCFNSAEGQADKKGVTGPHLMVYKTKKDYAINVPVTLSADRSKVVSYPDPIDVRALGKHGIPSELHEGYLLDNRGIGKNTAFLGMNIKEYIGLSSVPSPAELYKMVIDKDPMVMICDCGPRTAYKNPYEEINNMIDKKTLLKTCKVIKQQRKK